MGIVSVSVLDPLTSGTPDAASGLVTSALYVPAPVNASHRTRMGIGGSGVTYFFAPRDAFSTDGRKGTDLALTYGHKLGVGKAQVFVQPQVWNVFNQSQLYDSSQINTTVLARANNKRYQAFNPFIYTPVLGTSANLNYGPMFGHTLGKTAYTTPRTFLFTVGAKFWRNPGRQCRRRRTSTIRLPSRFTTQTSFTCRAATSSCVGSVSCRVGLLAKPFTPEDLASRVRQVLDRNVTLFGQDAAWV